MGYKLHGRVFMMYLQITLIGIGACHDLIIGFTVSGQDWFQIPFRVEDCVNAQADPSVCWACMAYCWPDLSKCG